ncbi:eukaryotic aspartyl protease family protein [Stylonychia lemnae]|uniref:Eukaryotic aspartyl protease family protein n=1 Tax=Stylonychia lemnae TaxID=5949 RepID=A0A077ZXF0_STYLE|nr:eukaryotic aspartyl protease family protein [Stylonychia lemnae]|eukprot:CDW73902.1 eukaryotic aspartyl protease family protein [Stylonychia lemnae]
MKISQIKLLLGSLAIVLGLEKSPIHQTNDFKDIFDDQYNDERAYENANSLPKSKAQEVKSLNLGENVKDYQKTIKVPLENYYNIQYFAKLYIGSNLIPISVIFDTGSSSLWISAADCIGCPHLADLYNQSQSFTYFKETSVSDHISYGAGEVYGYNSTDVICLSNSKNNFCMNEVKFKLVTEARDFHGLQADGVLGLSPKNFENSVDNLISQLVDGGLIERRMFSMIIGASDENPHILFGGYNMRYAKEGEQLRWHNLVNNNFWTVNMSSATISDQALNKISNSAIVDSGSSYILLPEGDFQVFTKIISKDRSCYFDALGTKVYVCKCWMENYKDFPDIDIVIDDQKYVIPSSSYVQKSGFTCFIKVVPQNQMFSNYWILGDIFIQNYYSVFDIDNQRVGLARSNHVDNHWNWKLYAYLISYSLIGAGLTSLLYQYIQERKLKQREKIERQQLEQIKLSESDEFSFEDEV